MGLRDDFRPGRPPIHENSEGLRKSILEKIDTDPPAGHDKRVPPREAVAVPGAALF